MIQGYGKFDASEKVFIEFIVKANENWQIVQNSPNFSTTNASVRFCSNQALPDSEGRFVFGQTFEFYLKSKSETNETKSREDKLEETLDQKMSELNLQNSMSESVKTLPFDLDSMPRIEIRVSTLDNWDCQMALGFGSMQLPKNPGYSKFVISAFGPQITSPVKLLQKTFLKYSFDFDQLEQLKQVKN